MSYMYVATTVIYQRKNYLKKTKKKNEAGLHVLVWLSVRTTRARVRAG